MVKRGVKKLLAATLLLGLTGCGGGARMATGWLPPLGHQLTMPGQAVSPAVMTDPDAVSLPNPAPVTITNDPLTLDGAANYAAIERVIREASQSIYVETFNFGADQAEFALCDRLIARAREGLKVRVLIDRIGNYSTAHSKKGVVAYLRAAGVDARVYEWRSLGRDGINITHRKLYLADGTRGLTGGMNLTQEFHDHRHDLLMEFRDDAVAPALHREFAKDWQRAGGDEFTLPLSPSTASSNDVVVTSPLEDRYEIRETLYGELEQARQEIDVESPYLSDEGMNQRLAAARDRGVAVRILIPGANNSPIFKRLNTNAANMLIAKGAEIRRYDLRYSHVKYFATDHRWALIGSANGDSRALNLNQELSVSLREPGRVNELDQRLFRPDWEVSIPVTHFIERPWYDRPITGFLELVDYYI